MRDRAESRFKAGLVLEEAVSDGLAELGIQHRRTPHRGHENVHDQLDLIVYTDQGRPNLEIQLTLRPKHKIKIFEFARRALTTVERGIRLYIEVVGSHRRSANLAVVGARVARAIKLIMRRFRDFGSASLLGLRIHANSAKIEKFDLVEFYGRKLLKLVEAWREEQRRLHEERLAAQRAAFQERRLAPKPRPFWESILPTVNLVHAHIIPTRPSPPINIRSHFVPRRFC